MQSSISENEMLGHQWRGCESLEERVGECTPYDFSEGVSYKSIKDRFTCMDIDFVGIHDISKVVHGEAWLA